MKRSTQVTLVIMAAAGIGGGAAALMPDRCGTETPSAVAGDPRPDCRSTSHGSSGSHGSSYYAWGNGKSSSGTGSSTPASEGAARGGFGSIGRAFASLGG
jgi:hypothetical protein